MSGQPRIPFHVSDLGPEEVEAAAECITSGELGGDGPIGHRVEGMLRELTGAPHVLLVTSATHAMELAMLTLDVGPDDEVICPAFTFPSTANAILLRGAKPVFADIRPDTLEIDADDVAKIVSANTRAVLPVDYGGIGTNVAALRAAVAEGARRAGRERPIAIIEDAAQGIDAYRDEKHLGTAAEGGALSFHATKNITCGEGGALLLNDAELAARAEIAREKGTNRAAFFRGEIPQYEWVGAGSSYALSELLAAVLAAQLVKLDDLTAARLAIRARYDEAFADLFADGTLRPQVVPDDCCGNGHLYVLRTRDRESQVSLRRLLDERGVEAPFHYVPLHTTAFATEHIAKPRRLPVTEDCWDTLLRLPIYPRLSESDQARVIEAVREGVGRT